MTLEQLRIFVAVAERQHVTAAARALHVTQSAASAAIAALETQHDIRLFDRIGRGIRLTETGRAFLDEARAVLARAKAAESMLGELAGLRRGTLRVVASQTIAAYWLPPFLATFRRRHPQLDIELTVGNTDQAAARVHAGEADLGIVEGRIHDALLEQWEIGADRLLLVQARAFTGRSPGVAWLRKARWVRRELGSGTRSSFDEVLRRLGIAPEELDEVLVLPSNEGVRTAVEAGAGIAALSSLVVTPAIDAGRLHALPFELGRRPFFGLRHRQRYQSRAAEALLTLIGSRQSPARQAGAHR